MVVFVRYTSAIMYAAGSLCIYHLVLQIFVKIIRELEANINKNVQESNLLRWTYESNFYNFNFAPITALGFILVRQINSLDKTLTFVSFAPLIGLLIGLKNKQLLNH